MTSKRIKNAYKIKKNEKMQLMIAIGYGKTKDVGHKSKTYEPVAKVIGDAPQWFIDGVDAALLAPTALNQQKI